MPKNRPMTRIDLDYNKNLKYPDINDYLKDTVYASNLTNFPDNQANATVAFKLVPNTAEWGKKINIAGVQWQVYLGQFRMYGYNPDLEAIDKMKLVIDQFSDNDATQEYVKEVRRRGTPIFYDIVSESDPKTLPIVGVVNYFLDFSVSDILNIYDYVFGTKWIQASEHYRKKLYAEADITEEEKQLYINYIKYRIYLLKIPVKLYYYYVNADDPGGVVEFDIRLAELLPTYKNKIDFLSKSLELNPAADPTAFDYFKTSYTSTNVGKMRMKGFFSTDLTDFEEEADFRDVGTTSSTYNSKLMANRLLIRQSQGYDISRPTVVYTYDFLTGVDDYPILNDEEFDRFTPAATTSVVNPITILNYAYGNKINEKGKTDTDPFYISLNFSTKNLDLASNQLKLKFQIELRNGRTGNLNAQDTQLINSTYEVPATLIAGDFQSNTGLRKITKTDNINRGSANVYRSNTILGSSVGFRMFSQRTGTDDFSEFEQPTLSEFQATLKRLSFTSDQATYNLTVQWPAGTSLRAFYNFLKCRWITLSIGNVFHEVFAKGFIEKNKWDVYSTNSENQLHNLGLKRYPTVKITGLSGTETRLKDNVSNPEVSRINSIGGGNLVTVENITSDSTKCFRFTPSDFTDGVKYIVFSPQSYIANKALESAMLFVKQFYILVAYKSKYAATLNYTYITNPPKPDPNNKFKYSNFVTSLTVNSTNNEVAWALKHSDFFEAARAAMGRTPPVGDYIVYIITNLKTTEDSNSSRIFKINPTIAGKFKSDVVISYAWKEGK